MQLRNELVQFGDEIIERRYSIHGRQIGSWLISIIFPLISSVLSHSPSPPPQTTCTSRSALTSLNAPIALHLDPATLPKPPVPPPGHRLQQAVTMADQNRDAAARQRIITHMNADHQDSLIRYLEYYAHLSPFAARNAKLTDITFDFMIVASGNNNVHKVSIKPPMTSWAEARPRAVAMDAEAVKGLGRSSVTVKRYKAPRGWMTAVMVICALTMLAFVRRGNFVPGSLLYDGLLSSVPGFAKFCWTVQPLIFFAMPTAHAAEAVHMERSRLRKHTVRMFSRTWWMWIVSNFVEGVGAIMRFDEVVREEEE